MEKLLKRAAQQVDQAEVFHVVKRSSPVNFYNFRQADVLYRDIDEISLRVIKDGRIGVVRGSATGKPDWMVDAAVQAAAVGPKVTFSFPSEPSRDGGGRIFDEQLQKMESAQMVADGQAIYDYVKARYPSLMLNLYFDNEISSVSIMNTSGKHETYRKTMYTVSLLSMYRHSKEGINKDLTSCRYFKMPEHLIDELICENRLSEKAVQVPTKKMPVLFRASSTWSLLYRILEGANGANKVRGLTPLKEKLDQRVLGDSITLVDDPTMDWAPGSTPFDDEGVPTQKKLIVDRGVFKQFIFDLHFGAMDGKGSTGNGIKRSMWTRGIEVNPNPRFNNLVLQPGSMRLEDMIRSMPEGIIVNDVIGFHSGNIVQGQYSMNVGIGFYVRNGQVQGRAIDTMIAGNIYDDFQRITGLGDSLTINPISYSPDILIDDVSVSGTAGN